MQKFDFENFKSKLEKATKEAFLQINKDSNEVCAFGLYTDESVMSFAISYNIKNHLKAMQEEDPDEGIYYRWSPGEWFSESYANADFDELNEELRSYHLVIDTFLTDGEFSEFRDKLFSIAVNVILELKNKDLFNEFDEDFILLFAVSEYENIDQEIKWVKKLNSDKQAEEFEEWLIKDSQ